MATPWLGHSARECGAYVCRDCHTAGHMESTSRCPRRNQLGALKTAAENTTADNTAAENTAPENTTGTTAENTTTENTAAENTATDKTPAENTAIDSDQGTGLMSRKLSIAKPAALAECKLTAKEDPHQLVETEKNLLAVTGSLFVAPSTKIREGEKEKRKNPDRKVVVDGSVASKLLIEHTQPAAIGGPVQVADDHLNPGFIIQGILVGAPLAVSQFFREFKVKLTERMKEKELLEVMPTENVLLAPSQAVVHSQGCLVTDGMISVILSSPGNAAWRDIPSSGSKIVLKCRRAARNLSPNNHQSMQTKCKAFANMMKRPLSAVPDETYVVAPQTYSRLWFNLQEFAVDDQDCRVVRVPASGPQSLKIKEQQSYIVENKLLVRVKNRSNQAVQMSPDICVAVQIPGSMPQQVLNSSKGKALTKYFNHISLKCPSEELNKIAIGSCSAVSSDKNRSSAAKVTEIQRAADKTSAAAAAITGAGKNATGKCAVGTMY